MELATLRAIVDGLDSLAEIEKEHPELGAGLLDFVRNVSDCCERAYGRLSNALGAVRGLPSKPSADEIEAVLSQIDEAPDSRWFKEVSGICDQLAALTLTFRPAIANQIEYTDPYKDNQEGSSKSSDSSRYEAHHNLGTLLSLLQKHEGDLKVDIRNVVAIVQSKLGPAKDTGNVDDARAYALAVQDEISKNIDQIKTLSLQIVGTSHDGGNAILSSAIRKAGLGGAFDILSAAMEKVPAVRYALGVAGIAAALAIIKALITDWRVAVFGVLAMLVLMVILLLFAKLTSIAVNEIRTAMRTFMWFSLIITIATGTLLFTSVFFNWPISLKQWITGQDTLPQQAGPGDQDVPKTDKSRPTDEDDSPVDSYPGIVVTTADGKEKTVRIVKVETTKDACAGSSTVKVIAGDHVEEVGRGESKWIEFPEYSNTVRWACGNTYENSRCRTPFRWVKCTRSETGRIEWEFFAEGSK